MDTTIRAENLSKRFVLHNQGRVELGVFDGVDFAASAGEAVILTGPSGAGKSTFLRILTGNYLASAGRVYVRHDGRWIDLTHAVPREVVEIRRRTIGYVSQFLRVIPRVATLDLVKDTLLARGVGDAEATARAKTVLARLNVPEKLWSLAPATFSGGEQQRINIARSFVAPPPVMLLDEPTASLDPVNRDVVVQLIVEARAAGTTIVGIFHDNDTRARVATRTFDLASFKISA
jgi:alpha-D-ribose 1-methylphosphonate 5-triphosphate synthase subunit PhnL